MACNQIKQPRGAHDVLSQKGIYFQTVTCARWQVEILWLQSWGNRGSKVQIFIWGSVGAWIRI